MALTVLSSAAEVLVATGHDPYARGSLRRPVVSGWLTDDAVAWLGTDPDERVGYLSALGAPAAVAALVADLVPELRTGQRVSFPRGTAALLPAWVELRGSHWDFRWTDTPPPPLSDEREVEAVEDLDEVRALLSEASPTASVQPGDDAARRWLGVRDPDGLVACVADTSATTGVGHVSAVAVRPSARGRGLGRAVTAWLMRDLLATGHDLVTLGMYADNTAGRALYDSLGMRDDHHFTSGPLTVRSRW